MYLKRIPRSMRAAFGPYTSDELYPMPEKKTTPLWVLWLRRFFGGNNDEHERHT